MHVTCLGGCIVLSHFALTSLAALSHRAHILLHAVLQSGMVLDPQEEEPASGLRFTVPSFTALFYGIPNLSTMEWQLTLFGNLTIHCLSARYKYLPSPTNFSSLSPLSHAKSSLSSSFSPPFGPVASPLICSLYLVPRPPFITHHPSTFGDQHLGEATGSQKVFEKGYVLINTIISCIN